MVSPEALTVAFVNAAGDYLVVLDTEHQIVFANKAFRHTFLGGADVTALDFFSLVDASSAPHGHRALENLGANSRQVELFHYTPDGKLHPVHYLMCGMEIDGSRFIAGVGRDKTPDLELLGAITQLNFELEKKQRELTDAYARMEQLAVSDQVTGLYNRHHFFTLAQHFFEEARRYNLPLSCFMLDIDLFKTINDHYGHLFGDHVLKGAAERLKANTRRSDLLARYGGEEFVMLAPSTDIRTAQVLGERLRFAIEREPFTLGSATSNVTVSIGVSGTEVLPKGPFEYLLDSADQALYQAKRGGRNRVVVAPVAGATANQTATGAERSGAAGSGRVSGAG